MAKSKAAAKAAKDAQVKPITSVKEGAITKPSQTPKSKSKEIAKQVAVKADKSANRDQTTKKSKKEPTPEPSASESESEASGTSASSASSDDEFESELESKPAAVSNAIPSNGAVKAVAEEDESSESSDSSDDDQAKPVEKPVPAAAPKNGTTKRTSEGKGDTDVGSDSEGDSGVSSDDSEEDSDEDLAVPGAVDSKALNGALKKVAASQQVWHFTVTVRPGILTPLRHHQQKILIAPTHLELPPIQRSRPKMRLLHLRNARLTLMLFRQPKSLRLLRVGKIMARKTFLSANCHGMLTRTGSRESLNALENYQV